MPPGILKKHLLQNWRRLPPRLSHRILLRSLISCTAQFVLHKKRPPIKILAMRHYCSIALRCPVNHIILCSRKPSHLMTAHGMIEIVEELSPDVAVGSQFGVFSCVGAISVAGANGLNPRDIATKVIANTSQSNALTAGQVYTASLRLIKRENDATFTAYYSPKQPRFVGTSEDPPDMVNEVTLSGFGIVI